MQKCVEHAVAAGGFCCSLRLWGSAAGSRGGDEMCIRDRYKGASLCGAALGMTCNGSYAFWAPFFTWVCCGVLGGMEGYALSAIQWIFAAIMIIGIAMVGDINPLSVFKKKEA